jgi:cyclopropane fatty-acyl-phospholipid synthase-like methyltransferase
MRKKMDERSKEAFIVHKYIKIGLAIGLSLLLTLAVYFFSLDPPKTFKGRKERSVVQMYDQDDLGASSLFTGHFINYGLWEDLPQKESISLEQRLESEKNLYRLVLKQLSIGKNDTLLEIGCGQGVGAVLAFEEFHPKFIQGIDLSKAQIQRAYAVNSLFFQKHPNAVCFSLCSAEQILFQSNAFDKIFSVQAIQHFTDLDKFAQEAFRVLKPQGKMVVAGFFGNQEDSWLRVLQLIPTVRTGIDHIRAIDHVRQILEEAGFRNITMERIGNRVWKGIDRWFSQEEFKNTWARNWYKAYNQNLLDYFLITAEKEILCPDDVSIQKESKIQ